MEVIGVIGMGYVGSAVAELFAAAGHRVYGYDIVGVSTDPEVLQPCDVVFVCVPTPVTAKGEPDMEPLDQAVETINKHCSKHALIVIESTVHLGASRLLMERLEGREVCYSPERIDPGNLKYSIKNTPKIVSGSSPNARWHLGRTYSAAGVTCVHADSLEAAEAAKLLENTFRLVNCALVMDLDDLFKKFGLKTRDVVDLAATKPYGFMPFYPGPGVGGHCIAVDPLFLSWSANQHGCDGGDMINLSDFINTKARVKVCDQVRATGAKRVLCMGMGYKKNTADIRNSASVAIFGMLRDVYRLAVDFIDPYVEEVCGVTRVGRVSTNYDDYDCVVLLTDHEAFQFQPEDIDIDTRGVL